MLETRKMQRVFSTDQDFLRGVPYQQLTKHKVRTKDGSYAEMIVPEGMIVYRGIRHRDCQEPEVSYGKWYGGLETAKSYARSSGTLCVVRFIKTCRLMIMTDPDTKQLLVSRFAQKDPHLQQIVSYAFGIQNLSFEKQPKLRQSVKQTDRQIIEALCPSFPNIDGYIFLAEWSRHPEENFHDEIFLCRPQECVAPIDRSLEYKFFQDCLKTFFLSQRHQVLLKDLFLDYFPFHKTLDVRRLLKQFLQEHHHLELRKVLPMASLYNIGVLVDDTEDEILSVKKGWSRESLRSLFAYIIRHNYFDREFYLGNLLRLYPSEIPDAVNTFATNVAGFINLCHAFLKATFWTDLFGVTYLLSWGRHGNLHLYQVASMTNTDWHRYIALNHLLASSRPLHQQLWGGYYRKIKTILDYQRGRCSIPTQVLTQKQQIVKTINKILPLQQTPIQKVLVNTCLPSPN